MMHSNELGIITAESWKVATDTLMACRNGRIAEGPSPLCVSGWLDPSKFPDDTFDQTEKHRYNLQMRLSAAGLKP